MSKYLVLIVFLVCGCMDKNRNSDLNKVRERINLPLTEDVDQILDALVERYSTVSRSMLQQEPDKTLVELKKCHIEICPYYEFDVQEFYSSPSPAKILECLSLPQDKVCLWGKREDGTTFLLMTIKENDVWKMESMTEGWENVVSWLPDKLLEANTKEYTPDKVCEEFVNEVNRMNLYQEKIKKIKSKIDIDLKV